MPEAIIQCVFVRSRYFVIYINKMHPPILGDPGAVSGDGEKSKMGE